MSFANFKLTPMIDEVKHKTWYFVRVKGGTEKKICYINDLEIMGYRPSVTYIDKYGTMSYSDMNWLIHEYEFAGVVKQMEFKDKNDG